MIAKLVKTTLFEINQQGIEEILCGAINSLSALDENTIVNISICALDDISNDVTSYMLMHIKSLEDVLFACNAKASYSKRAHKGAMDAIEAMKKLVARL